MPLIHLNYPLHFQTLTLPPQRHQTNISQRGDLAYSTDASQTHGDTQEYDVHDSDDAHHNDSADNSPSLPANVEPTPRESRKRKKEPSVFLNITTWG